MRIWWKIGLVVVAFVFYLAPLSGWDSNNGFSANIIVWMKWCFFISFLPIGVFALNNNNKKLLAVALVMLLCGAVWFQIKPQPYYEDSGQQDIAPAPGGRIY